MSKFLIQTIDGQIAHDFSFHLIQAIKYQNWYYNEQQHDYYLSNNVFKSNFKNYIPIGSVEFVLDFYKRYYNIDNIKPINIPQELMNINFLKRYVYISHTKNIHNNNHPIPMFVKSMDKIKGFTDIVKSKDEIPKGNYLISEVIDIRSEWRGFVYNGKLLDLKCYSGEFDIFPNVRLVREMIQVYTNAPKVYTIDIGINDKGTFLIECHQFFSCGLYGFADYKVLPQMFISCHKEILQTNGLDMILYGT